MNDISQPGKTVENESHYHSKKDRIFVRGIALPQAGVNREICRALKPKRFKLEEYGK